MKCLFAVLVWSSAVAVALSERQSYENYRVHEVEIKNEHQLRALQELEVLPNGYTFLDYPSQTGMKVDIVAPSAEDSNAQMLFNKWNITSTLKTTNLQKHIDLERPSGRKAEFFGWDDYHTLDEIYDWIYALVDQYPNILSVTTIGKTYENRDMIVLKLSHKAGNQGIFVDANIHAREWITSATVTWILNELLTSDSPAIRDLAENYDWYILPVANPDGFVYTHTTNRLWRKTRQPHNMLCYGTDPNRNFDFQWNNGGTSTTPCSDTYSGPTPESEIEVQNMSSFIRSISADIKLYLSIHSRGQLILCPFGYNNAPRPSNYQDLRRIGRRASVDMYKVHSQPYRVGTTADILYVASGISVDWAYSVGGIPLSYTFELRDQVEFGFILPADQIVPNAEELLEGIVGMIDEARLLGYM